MFWKKKVSGIVKAEVGPYKRAISVRPMDISMFSPATQAMITKSLKLGEELGEYAEKLRRKSR